MNKQILATAGASRLSTNLRTLLFVPAFFAIYSASAQSITNGNFNASGSNWNACGNNTEAYAFESTYGGTDGSNHVAEIDGNSTSKQSDNMTLCQDIAGFTIGGLYQLSFVGSRRIVSGTPSTVSITISIDGGALTQTASRNNTSFAWTETTYTFTATQTTHRLQITPNFNNSLGFIIDDIELQALLLPVELSSFSAKAVGCDVNLDWTVESAENFSHFELEKSFDGRNFARLEIIEGEGIGAYHFTDQTPGKTNYYRLKEVDMDGSFTYSKTVTASGDGCVEAASSYLLYPNPVLAGQSIFVDFATATGNTTLFIFNAFGQILNRIEADFDGKNTLEVNTDGFDPGIYYIGDQFGKASRFVIIR